MTRGACLVEGLDEVDACCDTCSVFPSDLRIIGLSILRCSVLSPSAKTTQIPKQRACSLLRSKINLESTTQTRPGMFSFDSEFHTI